MQDAPKDPGYAQFIDRMKEDFTVAVITNLHQGMYADYFMSP